MFKPITLIGEGAEATRDASLQLGTLLERGAGGGFAQVKNYRRRAKEVIALPNTWTLGDKRLAKQKPASVD